MQFVIQNSNFEFKSWPCRESPNLTTIWPMHWDCSLLVIMPRCRSLWPLSVILSPHLIMSSLFHQSRLCYHCSQGLQSKHMPPANLMPFSSICGCQIRLWTHWGGNEQRIRRQQVTALRSPPFRHTNNPQFGSMSLRQILTSQLFISGRLWQKATVH